MTSLPSAIRVVDSHTEGEPTRVVVSGWPQPEGATMAQRRADMKARFDAYRRAVICEPRGHEAVVGALLTPPVNEGSITGAVFFDNAAYLGMCGHGSIGVVRTLEHLGRISPGPVAIDTPAGTIRAVLAADGSVEIENVPAKCHARSVAVEVPGLGTVSGDVAYGGNWFFITEVTTNLKLSNVEELTRLAKEIFAALHARGVSGPNGEEIDHVILLGRADRPDADAKNFVLCPGAEYDRSPCGTGTSATMAVLHEKGRLEPGSSWRQEGITGSVFTGWLTRRGDELIPHIRGTAWVTGEATLHFDASDPFRLGIPRT
ncbi:MAG: proline racemase family protein [Thermoanaerobaculia bacterium]